MATAATPPPPSVWVEAGDTLAFAEGMHEHWIRKRERSRGIADAAIDEWYELGRAHGAIGGKLVGAGGDVPIVRLDSSRIRALGWSARLGSRAALEVAVAALVREAAG